MKKRSGKQHEKIICYHLLQNLIIIFLAKCSVAYEIMIVISYGCIKCVFMLCFVVVHCKVVENNTMTASTRDLEHSLLTRRFKNELEVRNGFEPRKEKSSGSKQELLATILPMLATPFILQVTFLPMVLLGIKFMLIQSIFLGKLALIFWVVNLITNMAKDKQGQFYSHNVHLPHP